MRAKKPKYPLRERRKEIIRNSLIGAAMKSFGERGYENVTLQLAKDAGEDPVEDIHSRLLASMKAVTTKPHTLESKKKGDNYVRPNTNGSRERWRLR